MMTVVLTGIRAGEEEVRVPCERGGSTPYRENIINNRQTRRARTGKLDGQGSRLITVGNGVIVAGAGGCTNWLYNGTGTARFDYYY